MDVLKEALRRNAALEAEIAELYQHLATYENDLAEMTIDRDGWKAEAMLMISDRRHVA